MAAAEPIPPTALVSASTLSSPRVSSSTIRPRLKASTRSAICTSSSRSQETTMVAVPSAASSAIMR